MFDAPAQIIAWAVAGLLALFTLGGCTSEQASDFAAGLNGAAIGVSNFNAAYQPPPPRRTVHCFTSGAVIQCR